MISVHLTIQSKEPPPTDFVGGRMTHLVVVVNFGPGTELGKLLKKLRVTPAPNCKCNQHIREMNARGVQWCNDNLNTIVDWLREEADKARLPFNETLSRILIRRAIKQATKNERNHTMTVLLTIEVDTNDVYDAIEKTKPAVGKVLGVVAPYTPPVRMPPQQPQQQPK